MYPGRYNYDASILMHKSTLDKKKHCRCWKSEIKTEASKCAVGLAACEERNRIIVSAWWPFIGAAGKKVKHKKDTEKEEIYNIVILERICNYWQDEKKGSKKVGAFKWRISYFHTIWNDCRKSQKWPVSLTPLLFIFQVQSEC